MSEDAVFINFTNQYPASSWDGKQLKAAQTYGQVVDLPFPNIAPAATSNELQQLADDYTQQIRTLAGHAKATILIMGEMTFTYIMVNRLLALKMDCVATTSERIVTEQDGKKISIFNFVQFRKYI